MIKECHRHRLKIANRKIISDTFRSPLSIKGLPKIYIVKNLSNIIYVGITSQSMKSRLRYGFKAKGKHGYHGYAWKNLKEVNLLVWCFPGREPKEVEGIEAEIVYLIRNRTGQWPEHQTEIHFHKTTEEDRSIAEAIYLQAQNQESANP